MKLTINLDEAETANFVEVIASKPAFKTVVESAVEMEVRRMLRDKNFLIILSRQVLEDFKNTERPYSKVKP